MIIQKASKEPILEEVELEFKPLEECEEGLEEEDSQPKQTKEVESEARKEAVHKGYTLMCLKALFSMASLLLHNIGCMKEDTFVFVSDLTRVSEEASAVTAAVLPAVSESQGPAQSLSQSQIIRTEESERPAEQQPPLEVPPEPSKAPLHVPTSSIILESGPMAHISASHAAGELTTLHIVAFFLTALIYHERLLISAVVPAQPQLRRPQPNYSHKSLRRFPLPSTAPCPSHPVCGHLLAGPAR